jgi:cytochrome c-type biogenesis protein CcmH/NrfG
MANPHYSENPAIAKSVVMRETGQLVPSISLLHVVCDEDPMNSMAWHQLGIGYVRAGKIDHAYRCLLRAADLAPDRIDIASHLANILVLKNDLDAAIEQVKKLIALNPYSAEAYLFLGNLYATRSQLDDALRCIRAAIERAPGMAMAHILMAKIQLASRQFVDARVAVSKALQLEPGNEAAGQILDQIEVAQRGNNAN